MNDIGKRVVFRPVVLDFGLQGMPSVKRLVDVFHTAMCSKGPFYVVLEQGDRRLVRSESGAMLWVRALNLVWVGH